MLIQGEQVGPYTMQTLAHRLLASGVQEQTAGTSLERWQIWLFFAVSQGTPAVLLHPDYLLVLLHSVSSRSFCWWGLDSWPCR